jgi:hypothetical protein
MLGTAAQWVDWEGLGGALVLMVGCLALRAWLLGPVGRRWRVRLERPGPSIATPKALTVEDDEQ